MGNRSGQDRSKAIRSKSLTSEDMDPGENEDEDDPSGEEDQPKPLTSFSLHRDIYTPLVRLLPQDATESSPDPELIPTVTDEDALLAELLDEEELDDCDQEAERQYEANLWEMDMVNFIVPPYTSGVGALVGER